MSLFMNKCTKRKKIGFFIRSKKREKRHEKLYCNPNSYDNRYSFVFSLFSFIIFLVTYFFTEKSVSETHWMLLGQRFPVSVHHGDSLRRFSTSKSFHKSLMKILELPEAWVTKVWVWCGVYFALYAFVFSLCEFGIPWITWLPSHRN